jgi:hypothetical protein
MQLGRAGNPPNPQLIMNGSRFANPKGRVMPRLAKNIQRARLNLELAAEVKRKLEELRDATNADSLGEVIRRAVSVYEFLLEERRSGRQLITRGAGDEREVVLI